MNQTSLSNKYLLIGALIMLATAFAVGRYTAPAKFLQETKTSTQKDAEKQVQTDKDQHVETTTVEVKQPDGTVTTTTKTVKDTDVKTQVQTDVTTNTQSDTKTEITKSGSPVTINALAGVDISNVAGGLVYGLSVSRPMLGPICVGVWGLTNKTGGLSVGLQF